MGESILKVRELSGGYGKGVNTIQDIEFEIYPGEIVGLIGLNGAGKSTTIKMMLGLLAPTHGEIEIDGFNLQEDEVKAKEKLGYIPEIPLLYDELTLEDHLRFTAMAYGMTENEMNERMTPLLKAFRMEEHLHQFPSSFSKGMRQKVMILCAFLHQPGVLLVDEPFIGLDPKAYRELTQLLIESKKNGAGVLVTTHVLDSAERLCDRFLILHNGKLIAEGSLEQLRQQVRDTIEKDPEVIKVYPYLNWDAINSWTLLELFEYLIEEVK